MARATLRQCSSISSISTSLVSSMPRATMARLSPTRTMSMPAWSATWALGKSWAVIMAMGSPRWCSLRRVSMVTFFLCVEGGLPMGECELCRAWVWAAWVPATMAGLWPAGGAGNRHDLLGALDDCVELVRCEKPVWSSLLCW